MPDKFKALIVDDEALARKDLRAVIPKDGSIDIIAEADSVQTAKEMIEKYDPDVIFLDIQMPGESGFDLLPFINHEIQIIFVTAFDEYAIRAFEVNALDYLMKPVSEDRLTLSIQKLKDKDLSISTEPASLKKDDHLFVKLTNTYHFIRIADIVKIAAADDYSEVYLEKGSRILVLKSMKEWESRLPDNTFIRIHRSTIINLEKVERVEPWFNNSYKVYLIGEDEPAVMSRRYFAVLKKKLG